MTDFRPSLRLDRPNRKIQRARRAEKFRRPQSHAEKFKGICREEECVLQGEDEQEAEKRCERGKEALQLKSIPGSDGSVTRVHAPIVPQTSPLRKGARLLPVVVQAPLVFAAQELHGLDHDEHIGMMVPGLRDKRLTRNAVAAAGL